MATASKTIVATGCSSGLGFELVKHLLSQAQQPYRFVLGARDKAQAQAAYDGINYDASRHSLSVLPLDLADLRDVKTFAQQILERLGQTPIDYLLLNAANIKSSSVAAPHGSKWCESYVVNHLSQHYLIHLLREKLVESRSRIIVVSSGAIRIVKDTEAIEADLKVGAGTADPVIYSETKFVQLLGAHYWRRQLKGSCTVVAVSPGLIPGTGLARYTSFKPNIDMADAKPVPEGASSIHRAFTRDDLPEDPEQIFLTSWGEWWPKDVYSLTLDQELQDKWCPSKEDIEKEESV
ncbi:NAD(P)-binding protein [Pleurostoma richardsiae]|uniref:NAD(P)-binding protein n=1 Tax=Pleurostoma richardsiae TaxID=41990 RepID=A0AA38VIR1_9PEZI|nr:NAD(P)-binding protein [Pleurostoma richardsiae]